MLIASLIRKGAGSYFEHPDQNMNAIALSKPETISGSSIKHINAGEHLIDKFVGLQNGPTVIVVGGVHGNEPAGVMAARNVASALRSQGVALDGRVYFLAGNTRALAVGKRYIDTDLNRSWTGRRVADAESGDGAFYSEDLELGELEQLIDEILVTAEDEVYVIDLHSTSAAGMPFATVGDTLRNREFARAMPIAILLGIEEQLEGTMLEYLNNIGCITLGFEGGKHTSDHTVANHEAVIWHALVGANIVKQEQVPNFTKHHLQLEKASGGTKFFEVRYRHAITPEDDFEMDTGFYNFDHVRKGESVAIDRNGPIKVKEDGLMLMPLYQKLGDDGFFVGRRVATFWLFLSAVLRTLRIPQIVHWLPGVRRDELHNETLIVDTTVAKLMPLQVFHLLGFRKLRWTDNELVVTRRRHDTTSPFVK
ncbi:MAG: succinylglutamate desuccinylase/aspartoacylase family protein [Blastocatellia bacterium]|nr:succinylglutamate desuccinylase/aspartoacylase family protein [Blastocatellia bacterium]